jgi:S-formylglutathione hydrolase FrmB
MLRARISSLVALSLVAFGATTVTMTGAAAAPGDPGTPGTADALHVVSKTEDGDRIVKYRVTTPSLSKSKTTTLRVNVLLPAGYREDESRRYPVLYALPGTSNLADVWLTNIDTIKLTAKLPMIIVMPDGTFDADGGGFYTDWVDQTTTYGVANWETFHTAELVPWVDANFRTKATRESRAIVGISQGGFGSMSYAARHPELFGEAASFSGAVDIYYGIQCQLGAALLIGGIMTGLNQVQPFAPFGDPVTNAANWKAHDPATQVKNLADTRVELFTSSGLPGKTDLTDPAMVGTVSLEFLLHQSNLCFRLAARKAGVRIGWHSYPQGTHAWAYGTRSLKAYLPILMRFFKQAD